MFKFLNKQSNPEKERLADHQAGKANWKHWGPYLSERQWGTVREDYSKNGEAWDAFTYEQAIYRAYHWGEDGIGGISDENQILCLSVSFWNGQDPYLKERLFGLTNSQGNHGEDVKEYYYYLANTPTHSYMKYLYKYPQSAFPYDDLIHVNGSRSRTEREYELIETGIFKDNQYFDIEISYAKSDEYTYLIEVKVNNRGKEKAPIHLLPTLNFRNVWHHVEPGPKGNIQLYQHNTHCQLMASHPALESYFLTGPGNATPLFVDNETNFALLYDLPNKSRYPKNGINDFVVHQNSNAVNPQNEGTRAALYIKDEIQGGKSKIFNFQLSNKPDIEPAPKKHFIQRKKEAQHYYDTIIPSSLPDEDKDIMQQAFAGLLWTKQFYNFDVKTWLDEKGEAWQSIRNSEWKHMKNADIISMPDKWEYPWYAVWDLAFHTTSLVLIDPEFAKEQLLLFLDDRYIHPNGQLPAYEWNFNDVNPPVHAWAVRAVYRLDRTHGEKKEDLDFLLTAFKKLKRNYEWWSNLKGDDEYDVYQGGFLGMDNIGVFDRSEELPTGGHLDQSDGTAWMALYAQNMIQITLELAAHNPIYEEEVLYYIEEFLRIASSMDRISGQEDEMWDPEDQFFYDVLRFPDGSATRLKVRSMVGLFPLCAAIVIEESTLNKLPRLKAKYNDLIQRNEELTQNIACPSRTGVKGRHLLAILNEDKLRSVLSRMLDESEFLSPFGIRSLSKFHENQPYEFDWNGEVYKVNYIPGESDSPMFGGNSNWRGPIWFPTNVLIIRSLLNLYSYYGNSFTIECPKGSQNMRNLYEIAEEISSRLLQLFLKDEEGKRPVYGENDTFQFDPNWNNHILFYEYFHAETGEGLGASHQTGWTANLALLVDHFEAIHPKTLLKKGLDQAILMNRKK